ncbi:MAG: ATP-binding protein [Anaerolineales bacterium]|nr:ATP-binding protein [Anaerolineales bacterium]
MLKITSQHLGQLRKAEIQFGDLTIFVGPQASGKSIFLQLMKLTMDHNHILRTIRQHGFDWQQNFNNFLALYFGEGMQGIWEAQTQVIVNDQPFDLEKVVEQRGKKQQKESLFLIPAQRVITLRNGWPRAFTDYETGDPYVVKQFSERLRLLMESGLGTGQRPIFPQEGRMNKDIRQMINESIFSNAEVRLDKSGMRKRIILKVQNNELPYMVWSAGQREFIPLMLGFYWLMPPAGASKNRSIDWVVIEEPEMGLHPQGISTLLILIMELLHRGYKVVLSTHSPQVLELIWAVQSLAQLNANSDRILKMFNLRKTPYLNDLADNILAKNYRTYYFERSSDQFINAMDISSLDPDDLNNAVADWGGLTEFSTTVSQVVSQAILLTEDIEK